MSLPRIYYEIDDEEVRARRHGGFISLHEAYAVIEEEMDEVWYITKQKKCDRSRDDLRKELIQVAAMAVKAIQHLDNFVGGDV